MGVLRTIRLHRKPRVGVFTGSRSEYGLLSPVIEVLQHEGIDLVLLIAGDHHEAQQGYSWREINRSSMSVVEMPYGRNCSNNNLKIAFLLDHLDRFMAEHQTDYLVIYGDRYETFAAAICAHQRLVKIIHLEGGDVTEGGVHDDSVRHAISKLATLHLPSNRESARNLVRMGEEAWRIKVLGLSVSDYITRKIYSEEATVTAKYCLDAKRTVVLFTIHPLSGSSESTEALARESIQALLALDANCFRIIITYPNSDPNSELIINAYRSLMRDNITIVPSLGRLDYHGILALNLQRRGRVVVVGNSSSGIKEAGFFKCVAVNIGDRQKSRLRAGVVIDCIPVANAIQSAIMRACNSCEVGLQMENHINPYQPEIRLADIPALILETFTDEKILIKRHLLAERQQ